MPWLEPRGSSQQQTPSFVPTRLLAPRRRTLWDELEAAASLALDGAQIASFVDKSAKDIVCLRKAICEEAWAVETFSGAGD
eukprot:11310070-Alexandrium_andersonii.AAC.1